MKKKITANILALSMLFSGIIYAEEQEQMEEPQTTLEFLVEEEPITETAVQEQTTEVEESFSETDTQSPAEESLTQEVPAVDEYESLPEESTSLSEVEPAEEDQTETPESSEPAETAGEESSLEAVTEAPENTAVLPAETILSKESYYANANTAVSTALYAAPLSTGRILSTVPAGTEVVIMQSVSTTTGEWYKIRFTPDDATVLLGYVSASSLTRPALFITTNYGTTEQQIARFPESYQDALRELAEAHPNWNFIAYETGLTWEEAITGEYSVSPKNNLVNGYYSTDYYDHSVLGQSTDPHANTFIPVESATYVPDQVIQYNPLTRTFFQWQPSWYGASLKTISYFMDPRNFLNETRIFMFEQISYSDQSVDNIEQVLAGTFMSHTAITDTQDYSAEEFIAFWNAAHPNDPISESPAEEPETEESTDTESESSATTEDRTFEWADDSGEDLCSMSAAFINDTTVRVTISTTYAQLFRWVGQEYNISPVVLASRVRSENGGGSDLITGQYPGYEGLYNFFNMGATGAYRDEILRNGLEEAKTGSTFELPSGFSYTGSWSSQIRSIIGGSLKLAGTFIDRGQDTTYLQKFCVVPGHSGRFWHQYMQNCFAPYTESLSSYRAYVSYGTLDGEFAFKIPVYKNMNATNPDPTTMASDDSWLTSLTVNGNEILNTAFSQDFTTTVNTRTITIDAEPSSEKATVTGIGTITLKDEETIVPVLVTAEDSSTRTYNITVICTAVDNSPFLDVAKDKYYYNAVLWGVENRIVSGTSTDYFTPNRNCTRAEAVTILWRIAGEPEPVENANVPGFTDIPENAYYAKAVKWAASTGIVMGYADNTFMPYQEIRREDFVVIMYRQFHQGESNYPASGFTDVPATAYYYEAVNWAKSENVSNGVSNTTFGVRTSCSRAMVVTMLYNLLKDNY